MDAKQLVSAYTITGSPSEPVSSPIVISAVILTAADSLAVISIIASAALSAVSVITLTVPATILTTVRSTTTFSTLRRKLGF
jgi:hypothetical protein